MESCVRRLKSVGRLIFCSILKGSPMEQKCRNRKGLVKRCQEIFAETKNIETVIAFLRQHGQGKGDSIGVLCEAFGLNHSQAKCIVHLSETWRDRRVQDEALHRMAERVACRMPSRLPTCRGWQTLLSVPIARGSMRPGPACQTHSMLLRGSVQTEQLWFSRPSAGSRAGSFPATQLRCGPSTERGSCVGSRLVATGRPSVAEGR